MKKCMGFKNKSFNSNHGLFLEGDYKIELDTKTEYEDFRGHLPHSKSGIFKKKTVGVLFEKIDFRDNFQIISTLEPNLAMKLETLLVCTFYDLIPKFLEFHR